MEPLPCSDEETAALLARFREGADERAFAELVRRYAGLVHGTARRCLEDDAAMAEEAAQAAFVQLARQAAQLPGDVSLGGWLHRVTCRIASNLRRSESRRRQRHQAMPPPDTDPPQPGWLDLAPALDAALDALPASDRTPLILRYFEKRTAREIGAALQLSEAAAQKRINRALGKLRTLLARRQVSLPAATIAALLGSLAHPAPATAAGWAAAALAQPGAPVIDVADVSPPVSPSLLAGMAAALLVTAPFLIHELRSSHSSAGAPQPGADTLSPAPVRPPPLVAGTAPRLPRSSTLAEILAAMQDATRSPAHAITAWKMQALAAQVDPDSMGEMIRLAEALAPGPEKGSILQTLLHEWAKTQPASAMDWTATHDGLDGPAWTIFVGWAQTDASAAAAWLGENFSRPALQKSGLEGMLSSRLAAFVLEQLIGSRPAVAIAFAEKLPPGPARTQALAGLAGDDEHSDYRSDWTAEQKGNLATALAGIFSGPLGGEPFERHIARWAKRDGTGVNSWLEKQTDPALRFHAALGLLSVWDVEKQRGPMSYSVSQVKDTAARASEVLAKAEGLVSRSEAFQKIAQAWPAAEPHLAGWLAAQNAGTEVDEALAAAAVRALPRTPMLARNDNSAALEKAKTAFAVAEKITDAGLREQVICGLHRRWQRDSPEQAAGFLDTSGWPTERVSWLKSTTPTPAP